MLMTDLTNKTMVFSTDKITVPTPTQKVGRDKDYVAFGVDNKYPDFIYGLYNECTTLQAIANGLMDFIGGNSISINPTLTNFINYVNQDQEEIEDIIKKSIMDLVVHNGFYIQILKNQFGDITEIYHLDFKDCRVSEDERFIFYSKKWGSYGNQALKYHTFDIDNDANAQIYYYKSPKSKDIYPLPIFSAAIKSILTSINIQDFHLSAITQKFMGNIMVNFNNGNPEPEVKEKIVKDFRDMFEGTGGKTIVFNWNEDKEKATTLDRIATDDFDERYQALSESTRQNIFIAFRATPALFGLMTESTGFNSQEFEEAYILYQKTMVTPYQQDIVRVFDKIFGVKDSIVIEPFKLEFKERNNKNTITIEK